MQRFINNWSTALIQPLKQDETVVQINEFKANQLATIINENDYCLLTLDNENQIEIIKMYHTEGTQLYVERGQENTVMIDWPSGTKIEARLTAGTLNRWEDALVNMPPTFPSGGTIPF